MINKEVVIIGGGLAGLTAAIHLLKVGIAVTIIEKNEFPKHKVCGEYISNEILPYFNWLDIDISALRPTSIKKLHFSTMTGRNIYITLPLGGFGISRYTLDEFLYKKAIANGCKIIHDTVEDISFENDEFTIVTSNKNAIKSKIAIGAYGKRSNIDQKIKRSFIQNKTPWLAVKAHYSGDFQNDLVGLHNFMGGYCGVSKVENNVINICFLANYTTFKQHKNIQDYQHEIMYKNSNLKEIFENSTLLFDKPLTISQISFENKKSVEKHILMIGDTAGLIHPLCGNGMAMAIHSAKIVADEIQYFYKNGALSRIQLEDNYQKAWNLNFKRRLQTGRWLSKLLQKPKAVSILFTTLKIFPSLLTLVVRSTHGKPIKIK